MPDETAVIQSMTGAQLRIVKGMGLIHEKGYAKNLLMRIQLEKCFSDLEAEEKLEEFSRFRYLQ